MSDSAIGSPAAGAVDPGAVRARLSDMGNANVDVGMPTMPKVEPGQPAQPAQQPVKLSDQLAQETGQEIEPTPEELLEAQTTDESEPPAGEMTPEQIVEKYNQWMNSDEIPDEFLDRPIWVPNGKKGPIPVRLRDIGENVLMYNDYQQKTTEIAQRNREFDKRENARKAWVNDLRSGDPRLGLRAINAVGAGETLHNIVVQYIKQEAMLESLPAHIRDEYRAGMQARERSELLEAQLRSMQQSTQQDEQSELEQQGMNAPDIQYTLQSIEQRLPNIYKQIGVDGEDPAYQSELGRLLRAEVDGERDKRTGEWIKPPGIQIGRAPTDAMLQRLAVAAKQNLEQLASRYGRGLERRQQQQQLTPPVTGGATGPTAKPGQRGNLSQPQRKRFSDLT